MSPDLLRSFIIITGLAAEDIEQRCQCLFMADQTILEFYMHHSRFPTDAEADFINDIGLSNFNAFSAAGILAA